MKNKMINILYQVINSKKTIDEKYSFKEVYKFFKFHSLEPFLFYANSLDLLICDEEDKKELEKIHQISIIKATVQEEELKIIKKSFNENDIAFLPIKGMKIRNCYPYPDMRTMADLDILVKKDRLKEVKKIMKSLGYTTEQEGGNHDVYYKLPFMNVEIHRNMIAESYDLSKYYHNIWDIVQKREATTEYFLSDEDHYIFIVAHSAKHYGNGGTGVRSVLDIYFYLNKYSNMDRSYIEKELAKLDLVKYESQMIRLANGWFGNNSLDEETSLIGDYILESGVYGTIKNSIMSQLLSNEDSKSIKSRKFKYILKRAFPPFKDMKTIFPSLKYLFILLPFYYLYRLLKGLITGKALMHTRELKKVNENKIDKSKEIKKKSGV